MWPWWAPRPSKPLSRVKPGGGFDSHTFPPIREETPCKSGVFAFIASWLKLSKNGNLCHYIATLNLKLARIDIKYVKMNQPSNLIPIQILMVPIMTLNMGKTLLLNGTICDASLKIYQIVSIVISNTSIHIWRDPKCLFLLQLALGCRPLKGRLAL